MFDRIADWFTQGEGDSDFRVRQRSPFLSRLALLFVLSFAVLLGTAWHLLESGNVWVYFAALILVIGSLAWFTAYFVISHRDAVLTTEFQSALFSAAAGLNLRYCAILRPDGTLVYFDAGFRQSFPEASQQYAPSLERVFVQAGIADSVVRQIYGAMSAGRNGHVLTEHHGARVMLYVDPLPRPRGYWVLRARDYVEQRHGGEQSSAAMAALELLADLPVGLLAATPEGHITLASGALENWLGYGPGEIASSGTSLRDIVYQQGEGRPGVIHMDAWQGDCIFQHKNGSLKRASVKQRSLPEGCGMVVDLTGGNEKKNSDAPVAEAQDVRRFIEYSPIAIARLSAAGAILDYNSAFRRIARREIGAGANLVDVLDAAERAPVQQRIAALAEGKGGAGVPLEVRLAGEETATASLYLTRMEPGTSGKPEIVAHLIDTTEQKNLEMRFAHSQKMQAVGQLAGGVAHDFNNLLTAMIGFCDLLLMRHPAGDPSFADIMQVKQNANRAANLVRQLLAFSRRQTLQPKTLEITDVLAELSNLIRRLIGENIELKVIHGRDVGMIKADQGQIEQVFINLAVNARDAMPRGGTLTIRTKHLTVDPKHPLPRDLIAPSDDEKIANGDYVLVEITDTGTGIAREIIQKIFEPFFSTKEVGSGTGLGLATCYGIIKQTGGYIFVRSKPGEGTSFSLFFPRHTVADAPMESDTASEQRANDNDLSGKGVVLLVEDENPVRIFAARALRNKGYTVLEADCGENAIEVMEKDGAKVDIIITDVIMPGMNGPTMIEEIGRQFPNLHPRVIFISGYAEDAFAGSFEEGRQINFLPKPFTLKQLAGKVKEVMG